MSITFSWWFVTLVAFSVSAGSSQHLWSSFRPGCLPLSGWGGLCGTLGRRAVPLTVPRGVVLLPRAAGPALLEHLVKRKSLPSRDFHRKPAGTIVDLGLFWAIVYSGVPWGLSDLQGLGQEGQVRDLKVSNRVCGPPGPQLPLGTARLTAPTVPFSPDPAGESDPDSLGWPRWDPFLSLSRCGSAVAGTRGKATRAWA